MPRSPEEITSFLEESVELGESVYSREGHYALYLLASDPNKLDVVYDIEAGGETAPYELGVDNRAGQDVNQGRRRFPHGNDQRVDILDGEGTLTWVEFNREAKIVGKHLASERPFSVPLESSGRNKLSPGSVYTFQADKGVGLLVRVMCDDYKPELDSVHPISKGVPAEHMRVFSR